ncbi:hypothetical protein N8230_06980 [Gammaproteobacteria bacterium]|nr:hypothetical protein [Gammaproteobacteria bacterium]
MKFRPSSIIKMNLVFILFLASCGGGGGGGGSSEVPASSGSGGGSTPATISGSSDNIALTFSASSSDVELNGSVTLTWAGTNATSCDASGAWGGNNKAASGTETVNLPNIGTQTFSIVCKNAANTVTASAVVEVYQIIGGTVLDGYIRGAEVFVDLNNNLTLDSNEPSVTTDNNGAFSNLKLTSGNLISIGGLDAATNLSLDKFWLTSSKGDNLNLIISPVTSIATLLLPQNKDASYVKSMLGIDPSIDIYTQDPLAQLDQTIYKNLYIVGNKSGVFGLSLQNFFNAHGGSSDSTSEYFKIMAETLQSSYDQNQSAQIIDDPSVFGSVIDQVVSSKSLNVSSQTLDDFKALMESLYYIDYKNNNSIDLGLQNFMLQTLQDDVKLVATNNIGSSKLNSYKNTIVEYIANDQNLTTADIDIPITANNDSVQLVEDVNAQLIEVFSNDKFKRSQSISLDFTGVTSAGAIFQANNTNADPGNIKHTSSPAGNIINTNPYINGISYSPQLNFCGQDSFEYTLIQGTQQSTAEVSVEVSCTNDNPTVIARDFLSIGGGTAVFSNVGATDIDGDALSYTIGGTDAQYISVAGNGDLSFTNAVSYASPSDGNGDNVYEFTVAVSDGGTSVTQSFQVEVTPGGSAPVFSGTTSDPSFKENSSITVQINASDPDGDPITLSISNPSGFTITSNSTGFEITNSSGLAAGTYNVQGVITDTNSLKTLSFSFEILVIAKGWQQLGVDIDGRGFGDNSGTSVSMNSDGSKIAIGAPSLGYGVGYVRVFEYSNNSWSQIGEDIEGASLTDGFGESVSISDDGTVLVVGSPRISATDTNATGGQDIGQVSVHRWNGSAWTNEAYFNGNFVGGYTGKDVDISGDGNTIIYGANEGLRGDVSSWEGLMKVWKFNGTAWAQVGATIYGSSTNQYDGDSVQVNTDGTIIAGAAWRYSDSRNNVGRARIFQLVNNAWSEIGDIKGTNAEDHAGTALSLSGNGSTVAILIPTFNENGVDSGQVRVYKNNNGTWAQLGSGINGEAAGDHAVERGDLELNTDGTKLIIGSQLSDGGSSATEQIGNARIFRYNTECTTSTCAEVDTWIQVGENILGESPSDGSGASVEISSDGSKVIIGAECNDGGAGGTDCRGHARIYEYVE